MARKKIRKTYFAGLVFLLVIGLLASAAVGLMMGNSDHMVKGTIDPSSIITPQDPEPSQVPGPQNEGTDVPSGGNTASNDPPAVDPFAMSPRQLAATMQDYSVDPATGMAKEIKVVDDNYLLLVNRTHPLSEDYVPDDMVQVKYIVTGVGKAGETDHLRKVAAEAFEAMVEAAQEDGIKIKMRTGYRSYEYQRDRLYNLYVKNNGQAYADTISAKPGQSEHQTGLALDVGGETEGYALSREFGNTKEGKWVADHCHEYGFIIRYTDGTKDSPGPTTGFISEPWHIRYIGVDAASEVHYAGQLLEEYLGVMN